MARGNRRRRELVRELGLAGQDEGVSTASLLERKAAASKKPRRRKTAVPPTDSP